MFWEAGQVQPKHFIQVNADTDILRRRCLCMCLSHCEYLESLIINASSADSLMQLQLTQTFLSLLSRYLSSPILSLVESFKCLSSSEQFCNIFHVVIPLKPPDTLNSIRCVPKLIYPSTLSLSKEWP